MTETPGDRKETRADEFDFHSEITALVEEGLLPVKIAEKLEEKLNEKNITLSKEQLIKLTEKINSIINSYQHKKRTTSSTIVTKDDSSAKKSKEPTSEQVVPASQNMKTLVDIVEKLQTKIDMIEDGLVTGDFSQFKGVKMDSGAEQGSSDPPSSTDLQGLQINPLISLPTDPEGIVVMMKWLQYLIDKSGQTNLSEVLDYYVDIDWLSEDVKIQLLDYSSGITKENNHESEESPGELSSEDHIQSFIFIQKLKGKRIDKHFVDRINGEINRWTKRIS